MAPIIDENVFEKRLNRDVFVSVKRINGEWRVDIRRMYGDVFTRKGICLQVPIFMRLREVAEQISYAIANDMLITVQLKGGVIAQITERGVDIRQWFLPADEPKPTKTGIFLITPIWEELLLEFENIANIIGPYTRCDLDPAHKVLTCIYCNPYHYRHFVELSNIE